MSARFVASRLPSLTIYAGVFAVLLGTIVNKTKVILMYRGYLYRVMILVRHPMITCQNCISHDTSFQKSFIGSIGTLIYLKSSATFKGPLRDTTQPSLLSNIEMQALAEVLVILLAIGNGIVFGSFVVMSQGYDFSQFITSGKPNDIVPSAEIGLGTISDNKLDGTFIPLLKTGGQNKDDDPDLPFPKPIFVTAVVSYAATHVMLMILDAAFFSPNDITRSKYLLISMFVVDPLVMAAVHFRAWMANEASELSQFLWKKDNTSVLAL